MSRGISRISFDHLTGRAALTRNFVFVLLLFLGRAALAQTEIVKRQAAIRPYKGFYCSGGLGPINGTVTDKVSAWKFDGKYEGVGAVIDLRIGGAIGPDLVLTGDIISRAVVAPKITINGKVQHTSDSLSIGEATYGVGLTYFLLPQNFYVGATLGLGAFVFMEVQSNNDTRSQFGISTALRAGKYWWVGEKWMLGGGFIYTHTSAKTVLNGITEELAADRIGVMLQLAVN